MNLLSISFTISLLFITKINSLSYDRYKNRSLMKENFKPSLNIDSSKEKDSVENYCEYGICEISPSYPKNKIVALITKNNETHSFFGSVIEPQQLAKDFISSRNGFEAKEADSFCQSRLVTKRPLELPDLDGKMRYIANIGDIYQQAITFEVCVNEKRACFVPSKLYLNYETTCNQRYNVIKLLSYDKVDDKLAYRRFSIPSTCLCTLSKTQ